MSTPDNLWVHVSYSLFFVQVNVASTSQPTNTTSTKEHKTGPWTSKNMAWDRSQWRGRLGTPRAQKNAGDSDYVPHKDINNCLPSDSEEVIILSSEDEEEKVPMPPPAKKARLRLAKPDKAATEYDEMSLEDLITLRNQLQREYYQNIMEKVQREYEEMYNPPPPVSILENLGQHMHVFYSMSLYRNRKMPLKLRRITPYKFKQTV